MRPSGSIVEARGIGLAANDPMLDDPVEIAADEFLGAFRPHTRHDAELPILRARRDAGVERVEVAATERDLGQMKLGHGTGCSAGSPATSTTSGLRAANRSNSPFAQLAASAIRNLAKRRRICNGTSRSRSWSSNANIHCPHSQGPSPTRPPFRARRSVSPHWQFLRGFLKHPVMVGSIIPSSRILIEKMLGPVDWENTKVFVEYGPGRRNLHSVRFSRSSAPRRHLVTIDTNADFTRYLKESIDDPRLVAVNGSAADVEKILDDRGFDKADYVAFRPALLDASAGRRRRDRRRRRGGHSSGRRVPRLSVQPEGSGLHRAAFRPDRPWVRMDQRSARDAFLGMKRTAKVRRAT